MKNQIFLLQKQLLDPPLFFLPNFLSHLRMIPFIFFAICNPPFLAPFISRHPLPHLHSCQPSSSRLLSFSFAPPPPTPPLAPSYTGPFKVLRRTPLAFQLQIGHRTDTISVHRLKPAYLPPDSTPAHPPPRGRPPADPPPPLLLKKTPRPPPPPPKPPAHVTFSLPDTTRKLPAHLSDFILA
jgi:hypothetical protein